MNQTPVPSQQQRENPEPHERGRPIPWFLLMLVGLMTAFGVVYITQSEIETPSVLGDQRSLAELRGTSGTPGAGAVDGAAVFAARCAACHQSNGAGLPGVFPPLAASEWVNGKESTLVALVLHGVTGSLTVKGQAYNGVMPTFKEQLNDTELAAVLTHLRSQWGNSAGQISPELVAEVRKTTADRSAPYNGDTDLSTLK
jgi:mono/diheme cytochrome c family protein